MWMYNIIALGHLLLSESEKVVDTDAFGRNLISLYVPTDASREKPASSFQESQSQTTSLHQAESSLAASP